MATGVGSLAVAARDEAKTNRLLVILTVLVVILTTATVALMAALLVGR